MQRAMLSLPVGQLLAALAAAAALPEPAPLARSGQQLHCVSGTAHLLHYDVEGPPGEEVPLAVLRRAVISVEPAPQYAAQCELEAGHASARDKRFCVGANQKKTCVAAKADLPLTHGLECKDCFVGLAADLYYKLNYTRWRLNSVEVGLRDVHFRSAAALHIVQSRSAEPLRGSKVIAKPTFTLIEARVACPVCLHIKITVSTPLSLDYAVRLHEELEATAGVEFDLHLGDQAIRWDHDDGWQHLKGESSVSTKPVLAASVAGSAGVDLGLSSGLLLDVNRIVWYRADVQPSATLTCSARLARHQADVCLDGDADFAVSHEADLHWKFLHFKEFHHWGPTPDFTWSKPGVIHKCAGTGHGHADSNTSLALVV